MTQVAKLAELESLGGHTEETLSALKLIISFAHEEITLKKYDEYAAKAMKISKRAVVTQGAMSMLFFFFMLGFYLYSYGLASVLLQYKVINPVTNKVYDIGEIVAVSQCVIMSIMVLGGIVPIIPQIVKALVCAKKVFEIIEREPLIKSTPGCVTKVTL